MLKSCLSRPVASSSPYKGSVVFGPRKWAYRDSHTPGYTFRLRLPLVRSWINDHFGS